MHSLQSDVTLQTTNTSYGTGCSERELVQRIRSILELNWRIVEILGQVCMYTLLSQRFHLLHHVVEHVQKYGMIAVMNASSNNHFNTETKHVMGVL